MIREELGQAIHVLDRFHVMKKMNEAIDEVRREEARRVKQHRLRAGAETFPLVPAEASGEPDGPADGEAPELMQHNLRVGAGAFDARRLPAVLGIPQSGLGGQVPRRMVPPGDAFAIGTDEEGGGESAQPSAD